MEKQQKKSKTVSTKPKMFSANITLSEKLKKVRKSSNEFNKVMEAEDNKIIKRIIKSMDKRFAKLERDQFNRIHKQIMNGPKPTGIFNYIKLDD